MVSETGSPPGGETFSPLSDERREALEEPLQLGPFRFASRLILGTGRYDSFETMQASHRAAGVECVTIAVRRERLHDSSGRNILDYLDTPRLTLLPNTAGCFDAQSAVRAARMGREILRDLGNPGADWVKLEVLGDSRTLLPDPVESIRATEQLVEEGFHVLCYTGDDPVVARRLQQAGATSVMPGGSPIGSGRGLANPIHLQLILDDLKRENPSYPVILDAGIGTASHAAQAMELGFDAVLLNSAVARADDPLRMAMAMKMAVEAGRLALLAGRIPAARYGSASSPDVGVISSRETTQK